MALKVKICGVRSLAEAEHAVSVGADLLGFNWVPSSPRFVSLEATREIVLGLRAAGRARDVELVGVVADYAGELAALLEQSGVDTLQLHGSESPAVVSALGARGYKAVRIGTQSDVDFALTFPGPRVLVDAKVAGQLGGTGERFDWSLLGPLLAEREVILAGGLHPENVALAVASVRPSAVDVASGVELRPGQKDPEKVAEFVRRAKQA